MCIVKSVGHYIKCGLMFIYYETGHLQKVTIKGNFNWVTNEI